MVRDENKIGKENLYITIDRWIGHAMPYYDGPHAVLRDNVETLHSRVILEFKFYYIYTFFIGADCNGDDRGNSNGKRNRFLENFTKPHPRRDLIYTVNLGQNDTAMKMTSKNNGLINPMLWEKYSNNIYYTCNSISSLFVIAIIYSIIYNRKKLKKFQNQVIQIAKEHLHHKNEAQKRFVKYNQKDLDAIKHQFLSVIQETAHKLMNHIIDQGYTQGPIIMTTKSKTNHKRVQMGRKRGGKGIRDEDDDDNKSEHKNNSRDKPRKQKSKKPTKKSKEQDDDDDDDESDNDDDDNESDNDDDDDESDNETDEDNDDDDDESDNESDNESRNRNKNKSITVKNKRKKKQRDTGMGDKRKRNECLKEIKEYWDRKKKRRLNV